ncbi:hypothetical protein DPSP01_003577 [Paraphaeosphaeria sporulosa]|uniref:Uncharacterized protein n=1 Tax=Paraphaeosphaeria sporulosa TaxID=1460663 RepID=A0A177BXM0_9PLEO|nr:uncharacterized protein CC84DRAFT_402956 [Paraphaeosphaeria sporulosa]OAF99438.1 hypothetical protein CC84DRAFT_402956 [Paraphaeosphaeria sporulosa]
MADPSSPNLTYNNPAFSQNHERRGSIRRSFTSSFCTPKIDTPRTLCPRDGDAFSYDRSHLADWHVTQDLWEHLPSNIQTTLAAVQQAGAAVLTGYSRIDAHKSAQGNGNAYTKFEDDELIAKLDALPPPKIRTISNASSVVLSDVNSPVFTTTSVSEAGTPSIASSQSTNPVSPICLGPSDSLPAEKGNRSRNGSFIIPIEPQDQGYVLEISSLRTEALPRLKHSGHKLDLEWREAKRTSDTTHHLSAINIATFEKWWAEKKLKIDSLYERGQHLSTGLNLSPNGLGWAAP